MNIDEMPAGRELDALVAEKICRKCGSSRRMKLKSGYTKCLDCHNTRNREYNRTHKRDYPYNKTQAFKKYRRKWALATRYGITLERYDEMLLGQEGKCAICGTPTTEKKPLAVDHDHVNGKVRGLLCWSCNPGLANFKDKPEFLECAAKYLRAALKAVL